MVVLKHEPDNVWAEKRMKALDEMRMHGFDQLPRILKDIKGNYLITLGKNSFSCIEYLEPDSNQSSSIEQMFMLASSFHSYSKKITFTEEPRLRALDTFSNENSAQLDSELVKWNSSIFETAAWETCVKCSHYFTSASFREIYNKLPSLVIHGDISPNNTIISNGKPFIIDLDKVRAEVRLLDFATFSGWNFLDQYLALIEQGKLSSCIQKYYGSLEEAEYAYFSLIVLYGRCGVLEWSLRELKQALYSKDQQKEQQFATILKGTIQEINEIYNRVPEIKKIIK